MEELLVIQSELLQEVSSEKRYLYNRINWSDRLIAIKGARGTGKTTLLLQRLKYDINENNRYQGLYASLDELYFLENTIVDLARKFSLHGGTHLFLDEVHKYPRWSREIKLIYDRHPRLNIIFTSSSLLSIHKGESDLSRRVVSYQLHELSFREYILLAQGKKLPIFDFKFLLENHKEIAEDLTAELHTPIKFFHQFTRHGAYPYFKESTEEAYYDKLRRIITLIVEVDMNVVEGMVYENSRKIMKLLIAISQTVPFTPNIKKLSERLGMNRNFMIKSIKLLHRAHLVMELYKSAKGIGAFTKPQKLYLHNTNLVHALGKKYAERGALRETFFLNQLIVDHKAHIAGKGDFLIDLKYTFEIGGKGKSKSQIQGLSDAFVVRDDMEIGAMNIIPLWLFGFLY